VTKDQELRAALAAKGLRYVGNRGNIRGPICFVGEAPGETEDQEGLPFVGSSGRELDHMLAEAGIDTSGCWWTNLYKTRPPDNKISELGKLGVDLQLFIDQFLEELYVHKPTFICPLGATPLGILCPSTVVKRTGHAEITKWRGSLLCSPLLNWPHYILPAFHPAFIFRAWDERQNNILCFAKLQEELAFWQQHNRTLQPLPQRKLISDPGADDAIDFLRGILQTPQETVVSIDIENIGVYHGKYKSPQRNRIPYVIGFSIDPAIGMSIGLAEYDRTKTSVVWSLIDAVLRQKKQVGQNYYTHDLPWLQYIGFSPAIGNCDDTLVRHHVLWPELSHKLDYQTFQYTREPYYKDEGKNWTVKERQKMKQYNCKDVCVTLEIYNAQEKEFNDRSSSM
jgi:uracil-DNA glycosylase family 4